MNKNTNIKTFVDENTKTNYAAQHRPYKHRWQQKSASSLYGAVDLGTNNCRLMIAQPSSQGFRVINSYSNTVRLGEGLLNNGFLSYSAMDRTIQALKICSEKLRSFDVIKSRIIATEACRRAKNHHEFFIQIKNKTGLEIELVSSNEEARLALRGTQNLLNPAQPYALIFDIGGGSTEIIWAKRGIEHFDIVDLISLPLGVVTVAEEWKLQKTDNKSYQRTVFDITQKLLDLCKCNNIKQKIKENKVQMLGTSGTVTTLGAIHLKLDHYDRSLIDGLYLTFNDLSDATRELTEQNYKSRSQMPCIGNERAELAVPGCAILEAICKRWPVGELRVADRGLRDGMLLELMTGDGITVTGNPAKTSRRNKKYRN
jgi:exopolyphosphatase/guanosine-5'-triphosphate,3'-diphosphate pyrophosphatase